MAVLDPLRVAVVALSLALVPACNQDERPLRDPTSDPVVEPGPARPTQPKPPVDEKPDDDAPEVKKPKVPRANKDAPGHRLAKFATADEFDRFIGALRKDWTSYLRSQRRHARPRRSRATVAGAPASKAPAAEGDKADDASITNNQDAGVDEGDIVKAAGDFFIILRRGRLFTVRQRDYGQATLRAVGRANAYPRGGSRGTWYDEMLVYRDRIIVIGYSYRVGGTEIGLFRLGQDGGITHQATHFLRSNDYYSSRNYASRLVGGKLIFYMPFYLHYRNPGALTLPAVTRWQEKRRRARPWSNILAKVDVYRPLQRTLSPTLHTVVQCDLRRRTFGCKARAVIGPYSRSFYVARDAVYVWVGGQSYGIKRCGKTWTYGRCKRDQGRNSSPAYVYRMPILGDAVSAIRARGTPIDQFSFKQSRGYLNVLLTSRGGGDWMWAPEVRKRWRGKMALLRVPVRSFSTAALPAAGRRYTILPGPTKGYSLQNRFVGDWVLWGAGAGWWSRAENGGHLFATKVTTPSRVRRISLDHGVDRIEAMGRNAVVVGSGKKDLFFTSVELGDQAKVRNMWVRANAAQGETRSHGFFFLPDQAGGGTLGLPIRTRGRPGLHLTHGSAEVVFLSVSPRLEFTLLGSLASQSRGRVQDGCVVSCVDWYGNARPIFFRGRIFALMGYELVEGSLKGSKLVEQSRINYLRPKKLAWRR